jgi:hypothetical protein
MDGHTFHPQRVRGFARQAAVPEQGGYPRSASAHDRAHRPKAEQLLFNDAQVGAGRKDYDLEIVPNHHGRKGNTSLIRGSWGCQALISAHGAVFLLVPRVPLGIGPGGGDVCPWQGQHQGEGGKIERHGGEHLADALGQGRTVLQKEGNVRADCGREGAKRARRKGPASGLVLQPAQHGRGVGAAAAQAHARGDALGQAHGDVRRKARGVLVGPPRLEHEVLLRRAVRQLRVDRAAAPRRAGRNFKAVGQSGHGDEEAFEVVVAVGPLAGDEEGEIDFGRSREGVGHGRAGRLQGGGACGPPTTARNATSCPASRRGTCCGLAA